jgi:hypothetical protein
MFLGKILHLKKNGFSVKINWFPKDVLIFTTDKKLGILNFVTSLKK